jgi:pimeloyl-ACP methyl ester carboxylesterase
MVDNTNAARTEQGAVDSSQRNGVTTGHAEVHGARLYYERAGEGEPAVFLHAGIADHRMWDNEFFALADTYEVIRYDLRGYGKSTIGEDVNREWPARGQGPSDEHNYSHAQDLYILLRTLGVGHATLIGASMGGGAAIDFALEQPTMTDGLVLVGAVPSGFAFAGDMPPTLQQFTAACQRGDMTEAGELATQLWFDGPQRQPAALDPDLRAEVKAMMTEVISGSTIDFTGENAAAKPAVNRLNQILAPTVVVIGELDDESIQQAANLLADEIPAADRVQIDGAAHLPNLEKPDEFYEIIVDFLDRIAALDEPESDLATGLGGAVERKAVAPDPWKER